MKNHFESFLWLIDSSWNDSYIYILNTFAIGASFSAKFKLKYHHFLFNFYANKSSLLKVTKNTFLIFNLAMILTLTSRPMVLKFMKVFKVFRGSSEGWTSVNEVFSRIGSVDFTISSLEPQAVRLLFLQIQMNCAKWCWKIHSRVFYRNRLAL